MAMASTRPRNARSQLQRMLGTRATVVDRVEQPTSDYRIVGWWASPHVEYADCGCDWCQAAAQGHDVYVGFSIRDAIVAASDYVRGHPDE